MVELLSGEIAYVYEAKVESDLNEYKGGTKLLGYFHSKVEAEQAIKNAGYHPSDGYVKSVQVFKQDLGKDYGAGQFHYYLLTQIELEDKETIKKRALGKLTLAEKQALGLE